MIFSVIVTRSDGFTMLGVAIAIAMGTLAAGMIAAADTTETCDKMTRCKLTRVVSNQDSGKFATN